MRSPGWNFDLLHEIGGERAAHALPVGIGHGRAQALERRKARVPGAGIEQHCRERRVGIRIDGLGNAGRVRGVPEVLDLTGGRRGALRLQRHCSFFLGAEGALPQQSTANLGGEELKEAPLSASKIPGRGPLLLHRRPLRFPSSSCGASSFLSALLLSKRPPPPCFAWSPPPLRGGGKEQRPRDTSCPSSAHDHAQK